MSERELIEFLMRNMIKYSISQLGIEGTLEAIENIKNPIQRTNMRRIYYDIFYKNHLDKNKNI